VKNSILKFRASRAESKNKQPKKFVKFQQAKEIGILINLTENSDNQAIEKFINQLKKEGKNVTVLAFANENQTTPFNFKLRMFTNKDINFTGSIKSGEVNEFSEKKYDYIFSLNKEEVLPFYMILASNVSAFKIGCYQDDAINYYDLLINTDKSDKMEKIMNEMISFANKIIS
jgi:hypothetical protein